MSGCVEDGGGFGGGVEVGEGVVEDVDFGGLEGWYVGVFDLGFFCVVGVGEGEW